VTPPSDRYRRLPGGRHRLSRAEVAEDQRRRLIAAAGDVLAERRIGGLSARLIARRAGVSNYTFYEHFESVDAVLGVSFAAATQLLVEVVDGACARGPDDGLGAGRALASALVLGFQEPGLAALMRAEVAVALPQVAEEREWLIRRLAALPGEPNEAAAATAGVGARRRAVGGALGLALQLLAGGESLDPEGLGTELGSLIV
jgi:AcrR family transcriptional regulator